MTTVQPATAPLSPRPFELGLRAACLATALVAMLPGLELLSWIWDRSEYLAHGYFIPCVSGALVYMRRAEILDALRQGPVPLSGPLWVAAAALFESAAVLGEISTAAGVGIPLMLAATAYAVGGRLLLGRLGVPILLLVLMVPPPGFVQDRMLIELKSVVMQVSVRVLQMLGYTVSSIGNRILIPGHDLFVAHACSGLTSIVTLSPLAVVVAYFMSRGVWRRAVVLASIVPFAVFGNILRVTVTVALVSSYGGEMAEGLLHESFGIFTFVAGTLLLIGVARGLERW